MKRKKIISLILILCLGMVLMVGCTKKCKADGCTDNAVEGGDYCEYHQTLQDISDAGKSIYDALK